MQDAKEEVRSRLNIEDVIGEYVRLKRAGRSFKGLSPFTQERTPSFMVSPDKHVWYDFSSNKGGDIFNFIMLVEGVDFRGALEHLARKAGVDMSLYSNQDASIAQKKERLLAVLGLATQYYQQTLLKNERALEYVFKERGLDKQVVTDFQIGFAPDSMAAVVEFLEKRGISKQDVIDAGLTNRRGGDLFRSRIMIPLMNPSGQVIGFTGRLIGEVKNAPKYLNTPQTLLYDKSRHVFGLSQAKEAIRHEDRVVLVEGNLDVVSSHQYGVKNVVATAGTALTEQQLKSLKRLSSRVVIGFDNDRAGLAATERTIPIAQSLGMTLAVVTLPETAKDPDELVRADVKQWQEVINEALPVIDWVIAEYEKRYDLSTAEGKKLFSSAVLTVLASVQDEVEKEHYLGIISEKTGVSVTSIMKKLATTTPDDSTQTSLKKVTLTLERISEKELHQDTLLSLAAIDPSVRGLLIDLDAVAIIGDERTLLFDYLLQNPDVVIEDTLPDALRKIETYVKVIVLRADEKYKAWSSLERYDETAKLIRLIKNEMKQQIKKGLMAKLRQAENDEDIATMQTLREELNNLIKEMGK